MKCKNGFTIIEYILLVMIVTIVFLALTGRIGILTHLRTNSARVSNSAGTAPAR